MPVHLLFDIVSAALSFLMTAFVYRWRLRDQALVVERLGRGYVLALVGGAVLGGYGIGTANLLLTGSPGVGRSIIGALAGAIAAVELFKARRGVGGSTGLVFVPAFCTGVAVGRIGCFLAGLPDYTYGTATTLPWGHDFGDGVARHPVQLYESAAMALFLAAALAALNRRSRFFMRNGFYLTVGYYAAQRFAWEWLKPYPAVLGPLNIFHLTALALLAYAATMIFKGRHV